MKRYMQKNRNRDRSRDALKPDSDGYLMRRNIIFLEETFDGSVQEAVQFQNVALTCEVAGVPSPSIHWLKDGKRIDQSGTCQNTDADDEDINAGSSEKLSTYTTTSVLYIDCLDETDQGNYTCVAQTATHRETHSTFLTVARAENPSMHQLKACAQKGRPARIYMKTKSVIELETNSVRFFCRAHGNPAPTITWYDRNNETIQDGGNFRIASNGDLIITNISWMEHMGVYVCEAKNKYGTDAAYPFVYPTTKE